EGYESDLTYLQANGDDGHARMRKDLEARLGNAPLVNYIDDPAQLGEALERGQRGFRLWDAVLVVVLLIGLFEPWLANQISARLYGKPRDPPAIAAPGAQPTATGRAPIVETVEGAAR